MPDSFIEVNTTHYGKRIMNSIGGIVFGLILFVASFFVLYNNEGSVDYSEIAKTAVEIDAASTTVDPALAGKLLVTNGPITSDEMLDDGQFLKPGNYLALEKKVEMFAWDEKSSSSSEKKVGGDEVTTTKYTYTKEWTASPGSSSSFKEPAGHENPAMPFKGEAKRVAKAKVGVFDIEMGSIKLPGTSSLSLNAEIVSLPAAAVPLSTQAVDAGLTQAAAGLTQAAVSETSQWVLTPGTVPASTGPEAAPGAAGVPALPGTVGESAPVLAGNTFIFISRNPGSSMNNPQVGDIRVSYSALNSGISGTVYGKLSNNTFTAYVDKDNNRLFEIFQGTKEEAVSALHQSFVMWKWIMRGVGFFMMWTGLGMILGPLSVLADVLPILGAISRSLVSLITFIVALVLSAVTILVAMLLHNVVALLVAIAAVIGIVFFVLKNRKPGAAPAAPGKPAASTPNAPPATDNKP